MLANEKRSLALTNSFPKSLVTAAEPNGAAHPVEQFSVVSNASFGTSEGLLEDYVPTEASAEVQFERRKHH